MRARNLVVTLLLSALADTLLSQRRTAPTILPATHLTSSSLDLTTTPSICFDPTHVLIPPAHFPDCERAAYNIVQNINPFNPVTFSHVAGSGFQLPADYHYKSCWISLDIDPADTDRFQPQMAYIAAWELARECTSGIHQFGGRRTVGPRDKVSIDIFGDNVAQVSREEGSLLEVEVGRGAGNVIADG